MEKYFKEDIFKKKSRCIRKCILVLLILINISIPGFAFSQKVESLIAQGKIDEAIETLTPIADRNDPQALYFLAHIYLSRAFHHFNPEKGILILERAVFLNYAPAIDELAGLYLVGEGVEKNEAKALYYYTQASHIGYGPSQFNLGIMYKEGQGTKIDLSKACLYLSMASLNYKDLDEVTLDAAKYRDEIAQQLTTKQRQEVLSQINALTLPSDY